MDIFFSHSFSILLAYTFGKFFIDILFTNKNKIDFFEKILIGYIFFGFCILITNFILPISPIINLSLIILSLFYILCVDQNNIKKLFTFILISSIPVYFLISYSGINTPDSFLYHLPYTQIINEQKIIFGLSNLHFRFGTISLQQYIDAGNINFYYKTGLIISSASIFSVISIKILTHLYNHLKKKYFLTKHFLILFLFLLFVLSLRFNRYSDFGNDGITSFYFIYLVILIFQKKINQFNKEDYFKISVITFGIFAFKPFYFFLIIPLFFIFIFNKDLKLFSKNNIVVFFLFSIWFIKNLIISGCLIYPLKQSCVKNLSWYLNDENHEYSIENVSTSGEAYAKSWNSQKILAQPNYIKNFNWLDNWSEHHLKIIKNKTQYALYFFIILFMFSIIKYRTTVVGDFKYNFKNLINKDYFFSITIILSLLIWFLKFPILRYSYVTVFLLFFFPIYLFVSKKIFKNKLVISLLIIFSLIFVAKNSLRIIKSTNQKIIPEINNILLTGENKIEQIKKYKDLRLFKRDRECGYFKSPCTHIENILENIEILEIGNYYLIKFKSI